MIKEISIRPTRENHFLSRLKDPEPWRIIKFKLHKHLPVPSLLDLTAMTSSLYIYLRMGVLVFLGEVRSLTGRSGEVWRRRGE